MPDPGRNRATDWLLASYEKTVALSYYMKTVRLSRSAAARSLFTVKSDLESCEPMRVGEIDYHDSQRWWL
jgi:hypothetical protein